MPSQWNPLYRPFMDRFDCFRLSGALFFSVNPQFWSRIQFLHTKVIFIRDLNWRKQFTWAITLIRYKLTVYCLAVDSSFKFKYLYCRYNSWIHKFLDTWLIRVLFMYDCMYVHLPMYVRSSNIQLHKYIEIHNAVTSLLEHVYNVLQSHLSLARSCSFG